MSHFESNRFQDFFEDDRYVTLKNHLYNYLLRRHAIERELKKERREMVLEVGSGISPTVFPDNRVVYSDISLLALQTLKLSVGKGQYVVADGMRLPFKADTFSHTVSSEVLEHLEDDRKALQEIARVTRQGGSLVVTFPHRHFYFSHDDRFVNHFRRYELPEMECRLREAGLRPVSVRKVLGPLEKITMCTALFCFSVVQRWRAGERGQGKGVRGQRWRAGGKGKQRVFKAFKAAGHLPFQMG